MLPPVDRSGNPNYVYPPTPINPSGAPNPAYVVPQKGQDLPGHNVPTTFPGDPWSVNLAGSNAPSDTTSNHFPDPVQAQKIPARTEYPQPQLPPQDFYLGVNGVGRDVIQRHAVESQRGNQYDVAAPNPFRPAPNPRWAQYPEHNNLTARNSPNYYSFTRPYDQNYERRLNGSHFSMADHRRNYPVFGMAPARTWRNTSRVEPAPWDSNIVDTVQGPSYSPGLQIPTYEAPMNSQQYVFGG